MDRGERRHRTQLAVEKQTRIWTGVLTNRPHYTPPDAKRRGEWRKISAFGCRCRSCRNPRHYLGLLPLPEQRLRQREPDDNPSMAAICDEIDQELYCRDDWPFVLMDDYEPGGPLAPE